MALYVVRAALEVNGKTITDFKGFTERSRVLRKAVPLMYKTGAAELTQRYAFDLDYVVPQVTPYDFESVTAGTVTIEYDDGTRTDFGGVHCLETGDAAVDGENEMVRKVSFMAETRNGATGA
jgi:hypothetical protein